MAIVGRFRFLATVRVLASTKILDRPILCPILWQGRFLPRAAGKLLPTRFPCPSCGRRLAAPGGAGGKGARCPACGAAVAVPPADSSGWYFRELLGPEQ